MKKNIFFLLVSKPLRMIMVIMFRLWERFFFLKILVFWEKLIILYLKLDLLVIRDYCYIKNEYSFYFILFFTLNLQNMIYAGIVSDYIYAIGNFRYIYTNILINISNSNIYEIKDLKG